MNFKYLLGAVLSIPLLPIMYLQGKRICASVPKLPEASGTTGTVRGRTGQKLRIITIGESAVAGVGVDTHKEGFTGVLAKELAQYLGSSIHWKVYAKNGYTVQQMTTELVPKITEKEADLIVVGAGGNDAFILNRPGVWRKQQGELIDALRAKLPNTPIVFTHMPPIGEFPAFTPLIRWVLGNLVDILGEELKQVVAKRAKVYYSAEKITFREWSQRYKHKMEGKPIEAFFCDGVHPSKLSYQIWAIDMARFIVQQTNISVAVRTSTNKHILESQLAY